jgi:hydrogenase expression/formation protein HypE
VTANSGKSFTLACPAPGDEADVIQLAHGGGGRAMARLIDEVIRPAFGDPELDRRHDGAVLEIGGPLAFTTDSYVINPLFFPGGDIGSLAVHGTVNDLAMCGARAISLSLGLIIEEGLPMASLRNIVASIGEAARANGLRVMTGDTKVVDRGKADGIFINTSGIGRVVAPSPIGAESVRTGDAIILSGDIGRHGMAVMAARHGMGFETVIESDCAPLADPVLALLEAKIDVHCLRDLTRGGLASALVELAETAGLTFSIGEAAVPVRADVAAACEILGLDPLHVACEGRCIAFVPAVEAPRAIEILRGFATTTQAVVIGEVRKDPGAEVVCCGLLGTERTIDMLSGEQLPRIC